MQTYWRIISDQTPPCRIDMKQPEAQDILSVMCAPALVCTAAGVIRSINEFAADRLGIPTKEAAGVSVSKILDTSGEQFSAFLQRTQITGYAISEGVVYKAGDNSKQATVMCHAQRLRGKRMSNTMLIVMADIATSSVPDRYYADCSGIGNSLSSSSHKSALDRQCAASFDPDGAKALSNVALGLVHEVNQPLTAIAAYAHSCRHWLSAVPEVHPRLLPTVDKIIEQVHITGQIVNSLKGLVRGQNDEREQCDMNVLVRESLDLLALDNRLERCDVKLHLTADPCLVSVNSVQIKIVLLNLMRNGLDASLASNTNAPRLSVTVKADEEHWVCAEINDSGEGISDEAGQQLFQPFETSKPNGLGLGLIISRCLASSHAGQIVHTPGVPDGASFRLRLPPANVKQI